MAKRKIEIVRKKSCKADKQTKKPFDTYKCQEDDYSKKLVNNNNPKKPIEIETPIDITEIKNNLKSNLKDVKFKDFSKKFKNALETSNLKKSEDLKFDWSSLLNNTQKVDKYLKRILRDTTPEVSVEVPVEDNFKTNMNRALKKETNKTNGHIKYNENKEQFLKELDEVSKYLENSRKEDANAYLKLNTDIHKYNIGKSDYSKHKIQPWDIWEEYNLDPWDADIIKRLLRRTGATSRADDYRKIIHVCLKQLERLGEVF